MKTSYHALYTLLSIAWVILVTAAADSPSCSSFNIDPKVLEMEPPLPNPHSAIGRVFAALEGQLKANLVPQPSGPACYEWVCQSAERKGENCQWCLPSIFVGGIAKCGTTALCDKLVTHPDVRFYRAKETDIFTKMRFSISELEKKTNADSDDLPNHSDANNSSPHLDADRFLRRAKHHNKGPRNPNRHVGNVWLDCSAGAFRDFNAAAHLRKYSPDTKIVLIVRDPWQVLKQGGFMVIHL